MKFLIFKKENEQFIKIYMVGPKKEKFVIGKLELDINIWIFIPLENYYYRYELQEIANYLEKLNS